MIIHQKFTPLYLIFRLLSQKEPTPYKTSRYYALSPTGCTMYRNLQCNSLSGPTSASDTHRELLPPLPMWLDHCLNWMETDWIRIKRFQRSMPASAEGKAVGRGISHYVTSVSFTLHKGLIYSTSKSFIKIFCWRDCRSFIMNTHLNNRTPNNDTSIQYKCSGMQ